MVQMNQVLGNGHAADAWAVVPVSPESSVVTVAALGEASNQSITLCSPACTGTFTLAGSFQSSGSPVGGEVATSAPSATSTFEAFGTISIAAKARGAIVTLK